MRPTLSYANVASTLALVIAVGGGGVAIASGFSKDSVSSWAIHDNSVTSADIRDSTIRPQDLKPGSVSGYRIKDGTIRAKDIRKGTLLGTLVADGTLTGTHLAKGSLTGAHLAKGSLTGTHLAQGSITGSLLADGTLTGTHLADGSLTGTHLADGSLTGTHLADGSLTGAHLAQGSITGSLLADGTLTGTQVANDSLTGDDIDESTLDLDLPAAAPGAIVVASLPSPQVTLTAGPNQGGMVQLTAPTAGIAMVTVQAEFNATTGSRFIQVNPTRDGVPLGFYDWDAGDFDGLFDQRQSAFAVVRVNQGTHTFAFTMTEERTSGSYSSFYGAQIAVQFFPSAPAAGAPVAPRRMVAPNR